MRYDTLCYNPHYSCTVAAWGKVSPLFLLMRGSGMSWGFGSVFLFPLFFSVSHLCMQIYASPPIFIIMQRTNYNKNICFFSIQRESNSWPLNLQSSMLSTRLRRHALISKSKNKYLIVKLVPKALASFQDGGRFLEQAQSVYGPFLLC